MAGLNPRTLVSPALSLGLWAFAVTFYFLCDFWRLCSGHSLCLHKYLTNWDVSPVYKGLALTIILPFRREIKCVIKKYQADTKYLWSKAQVLICTRCLWKMHTMSKDPASCQSWGYRNPSTTKKSPIVWNTVIQKVSGGGGGGELGRWGGVRAMDLGNSWDRVPGNIHEQ